MFRCSLLREGRSKDLLCCEDYCVSNVGYLDISVFDAGVVEGILTPAFNDIRGPPLEEPLLC